MTVEYIKLQKWQFIKFEKFEQSQQANIKKYSYLISQMRKLRRNQPQQLSQQSQSIGKYLSFEQKQTEYPEPIDNSQYNTKQESPKKQIKKRGKSAKKANNRSTKKQSKHQEIKQVEVNKISGRKSKRLGNLKKNQNIDLLQLSEIQASSQSQKNSQSIKDKSSGQKQKNKSNKTKNRSLRKRKNLIETKESQQFKNTQLRQQSDRNQKQKQIQDNGNNQSQSSSNSQINFNRRRKSKKKNDKEIMDMIYARYTQDEASFKYKNKINQDSQSDSVGRVLQSDLTELQLLIKKKQKKGKKQKQIKIKNKYFQDISFPGQHKSQIQNDCLYEGQEPPENCQQLIIEKKQPKLKKNNLNQMIEKKVNQVKDRRQFKSSEGDLKFKNHIKMKLEQVKDAEQIQIDVSVPNVFTKKTASAALYMKNIFEKQQRIAKYSQISQDNPQKLKKTVSSQDIISKKQAPKKIIKQQPYQNKKKGIRREDFFNHLTKQIKNKKHTSINSQQLKQCFKTSSLDETDFDGDLADDIRSNYSSRSGSRNSNNRILQRRESFDSQRSRQTQQSIHSKGSINSSKMRDNPTNKLAIQSNRDKQASNSVSFRANPFVSNKSLVNMPISEVKQSQASSSIQNVDSSHNFSTSIQNAKNQKRTLNFDNEQIQQEVRNTFQKSYKIFQSQEQKQIQLQPQKLQKNNLSEIKQLISVQQQQNNENIFLKMKNAMATMSTKDKKKSKKQNKDKSKQEIDEFLNDKGDEQQQKKIQKKKHKQKRGKKTKPHQDSLNSFFQIEADYSSSQQGHSDQQQDNADDSEGSILDLIDQNQLSNQNENLVRKKYLEDQQKRQDQIVGRLMKGMYGRKKYQQTESQRKLKQRMKQAAIKNKYEDQQQENSINQPAIIPVCYQEVNVINVNQDQNIDSRQRKKLRQLEEQFAYGGFRPVEYEDQSNSTIHKGQAWRTITAVLPVRKSCQGTAFPRSGIKNKAVSRQKSGEHKKFLLDLKSNDVQQQIYNKRISFDRNKVENIEKNRNKLQKTGSIQLDIRDSNANTEEDIQI